MSLISEMLRAYATEIRDKFGEATVKFREDLEDSSLELAETATPIVAGLVQTGLADLGLYKGKIENYFGEKSQEALKTFDSVTKDLSQGVDDALDDASAISADMLDRIASEIERRKQS